MRYLKVALAKGRLAELSVDIFETLGFDVAQMKEKNRKLVFTDEKNKIMFYLVKAADVPTYVEYGAADIGIVGKDTILEESRDLYEMVDLKFGACRMCVAGPPEMKEQLNSQNSIRVATKYPKIARDYFEISKGRNVEIIKLNGSVELAAINGLSEVIVDIVESGKTLEENGLMVLEEICNLTARLVVNRVSAKTELERISNIVADFRKHIDAMGDKK